MPPPVTPHWTYMGCNALNTGVRTMAGISVAVWDRNCPGVGGTIPILPLHFIYLFIYHLFGCLFVIYLFVIYLFIYSLSIYLFIYLIAIVYYHYLFTCYLPFTIHSFICFFFCFFSEVSKHSLLITYYVHIWQVSPQLSFGDTCQIWTWFNAYNR